MRACDGEIAIDDFLHFIAQAGQFFLCEVLAVLHVAKIGALR